MFDDEKAGTDPYCLNERFMVSRASYYVNMRDFKIESTKIDSPQKKQAQKAKSQVDSNQKAGGDQTAQTVKETVKTQVKDVKDQATTQASNVSATATKAASTTTTTGKEAINTQVKDGQG